MGLTALREKNKTKLNPAARDDILRSKDTKRLVCVKKLNRIYIIVLPLSCHMADRRLISALPPPTISQINH